MTKYSIFELNYSGGILDVEQKDYRGAKTVGFFAPGYVYLTFDQATALCEAITAHINAENAKAAAQRAKGVWEAGNVKNTRKEQNNEI